jgi:predicted RecA/RadA family phage recombinase
MKNFVQGGDTLTLTAGSTIAAGAGVLFGSLFAVAVADVASGADGAFLTEGVFDLPKVGSQAWTVGALIYWNGTACTNVASTNKLIGAAVKAVGSGAGETSGRVRLNGSAVTA